MGNFLKMKTKHCNTPEGLLQKKLQKEAREKSKEARRREREETLKIKNYEVL